MVDPCSSRGVKSAAVSTAMMPLSSGIRPLQNTPIFSRTSSLLTANQITMGVVFVKEAGGCRNWYFLDGYYQFMRMVACMLWPL